MLRPELAILPMVVPRASVIEGTRRLFARSSRLEAAWYQAAADEFLRVFATPRGRIAFFSAAREIYLDEPFGRRGFWSRLEKLERPALFVWGDRDFLVPSAFARHVERSLPRVRSVILQNCGHVPQFEQPEITHRLVREFWQNPIRSPASHAVVATSGRSPAGAHTTHHLPPGPGHKCPAVGLAAHRRKLG